MIYVRYILARIASAALTLFGVSVFVFFAIHLIPGHFQDVVGGLMAPPELKAAIAHRLGLDRPLLVQYILWLGSAVHGDFGVSLTTQQPLSADFLRRTPVTAELTAMSAGLSLLLGLPLGVAAGLAGGSAQDRGLSLAESTPPEVGMLAKPNMEAAAADPQPAHNRIRAAPRLRAIASGFEKPVRSPGLPRFIGSLGLSVPDFVLGSLLVYVFSAFSLGLTVGGYVPFFDDPGANLKAMLLPVITLSVFGVALIQRTARDAVRNVLTEPYITAAVARGESPSMIIKEHVLRNAAIPVVTVLTTMVGYLMGGAVIVEVLFSMPGLGHYVTEAVADRDYPAVEAAVMLAAFIFIAVNMLTDIAYVFIDPRIGSRRALSS